MGDHLKEEVDTENEVVNTEVKVKKEYVMTEARSENLRRARLKATLLREQLKEKQQPKDKPKSKLEKKLEDLEANTKDAVKLNDKDIAREDTPKDTPIVSEIETPEPIKQKVETQKTPILNKPVEPVVETPKVVIDPPKPKPSLFRREGNYLYM